jgi:hypothetical protein
METHSHSRHFGRPAYFLGRPASLWIEATSRRQWTRSYRPPSQPARVGVTVTPH